ncbi:unnamed protein product [Cuscuta europaea]|uniref:Uncharacterized protein n=1 Tax=Cuscuta europaea TaxID=41803 RepID=A0A9P1EM52_CUSEU|nr:unnamed protein product [Cuscuta europaea]
MAEGDALVLEDQVPPEHPDLHLADFSHTGGPSPGVSRRAATTSASRSFHRRDGHPGTSYHDRWPLEAWKSKLNAMDFFSVVVAASDPKKPLFSLVDSKDDRWVHASSQPR